MNAQNSLLLFMRSRGYANMGVIKLLESYADLTQEGYPRVDAFLIAFPGVDVFQFIGDGLLSQYYCGPDRDYDID